MAQFPLIDQASLVMIPGAYKESKVYSQLPTDGSGDFTFSRGTDNATIVNEEGLIEKGYENLFLQSNTFSDAAIWIGSNTNRTGGQQGYDGSTDAWLYEKLSLYSSVRQNITYNGVGTCSVYAKAGTLDWIRMGTSTGVISGYFDLSNGVVGSIGSSVFEAKIESVGNEWYRCSIAFNGSISRVEIIGTEGNATFNPSSGSIYIQDAQLNQGLVAYPYLETTTAPAYGGITANQPRLDYTDSSCPALLLEPQRTNAYRSSEWIPNLDADLSQEVSDVDSPIENTPFLKITKTSSGLGRQTLYTSTNGDIDTCSVFAKKGSTGGNQILFADSYYGTSTMNASFDLDTGSWFETPSGTALIDYGFEDFGNGMYRIWVAGKTRDNANPNPTEWRSPVIYFDDSQLAIGEYIYITGLQTERDSSYPTSYIPTYGTSQTRSKDSCKNTTITDFQSTDATLFFEFNYDSSKTGNFRYVFSTENSTASNFDLIGLQSNSSGNNFFFTITNSGISFPTLSLLSGTNKVLLKLERSTKAVKTFLNGTEVTSATATSIPEIHKIALGGRLNAYSGFATDRELGDIVKQALVFPTALTDSECIALTTL